MSDREKQILYYLMADGRSPFLRWREAITDKATRARIDARIRRVSTGNLGDCQPVGEGVFELRVHFGAGYRVYFANDGEEIVLLLVGGSKATQDKDIKNAKEYWADYGRRKR
jgi:putative addiction module killer protein